MSKGGARPGSRRLRPATEAKKASVTISVTGTTAKMLRELRNSDTPINEMIEAYIVQTFHECKPYGTFENPK